MNFDFSGQTVLVSGGVRGIGRGVSELFLKAGAKVCATYAGNHVAAEAFRTSFSGYPLETVCCDASSATAVEAFFNEWDKRHDRLDILVNNAGIRRDYVLAMMPCDDWNAVIDTNLTGTFLMSKQAVMRMSGQRFGRIVCITSPSGRLGFAGQSNYAAAKAGQVALCKSLSKEVARRNITVNCVSPGFTDTELLADLSPEQRKAYEQQVPMKRFARVEEIAQAVAFLSSKAAGYITGQVLEVSGGL